MEHLEFLPHAICWRWNPWIIALHAPADLVIFAAYMVSPYMLFRVFRLAGQRMPAATPGLWGWCAAFVFCCGLTHLGAFFEVFSGGALYWYTGLNKLLTAAVSVKFTWELWKVHNDLAVVASALKRDEE